MSAPIGRLLVGRFNIEMRIFSLLAVLALAAGCDASGRPTQTPVQRGAYLVTTIGCADCHTPKKLDPALGMPVPDLARQLSGHPAGGPEPAGQIGEHDMALIGPTFTSFRLGFGTVYSGNITPDVETGIGRWTEEQFVQTMRTGKWMGIGRPLLPPMPWPSFAALTDADLRAIYAYLRTVPAVANRVPDPQVPSPVLAAFESTNAALAKR
jgi:mono/diheme cytochrome c family protein